jgi:hypothetical protein
MKSPSAKTGIFEQYRMSPEDGFFGRKLLPCFAAYFSSLAGDLCPGDNDEFISRIEKREGDIYRIWSYMSGECRGLSVGGQEPSVE